MVELATLTKLTTIVTALDAGEVHAVMRPSLVVQVRFMLSSPILGDLRSDEREIRNRRSQLFKDVMFKTWIESVPSRSYFSK